MQTNIHSIGTTQARKLRQPSLHGLKRDDFDAKLPFARLLEMWFPQGRWGSNGREYVFYSPDFIADLSRELWFDIASGATGIGLIELVAHRYGVDIDEAEKRMRMWAMTADPIEDKDGVDWGMPESAQAS